MIGASLDNWCDRVFFVGFDKFIDSFLNTLDKVGILTDRASQTDDIWVDEILDIEQALRQIAVHALNGFLDKGHFLLRPLGKSCDRPNQSDQIFQSRSAPYFQLDASCDQLLSFSARGKGGHVAKFSTQAMGDLDEVYH